MTVDLPSYPNYKPSGLSWLDHLPAHWEIKRNGRLFSQRKETGFAELPILEVSLHTGVRVRRFDAAARKQVMSDRSKYQRAAKGDVAYNMMRMWQGAVGVAPEDGLVSPAYVVASPFASVEPKYFSELFRTSAYMGEVDANSRGIVKDRNRLYWEDFKQIFSIYPPPGEQQSVVRFITHLDHAVGRYIRTKRRVVDLLEEQKRVLTYQAVTRGTELHARLRSSGVEWIGAVPGHWTVASLRHRYSQSLGKMLDAKRITGEHLVPYLRNTDVQWDQIRTENLPKMDIPRQEFGRYTVQAGDLLVCEGGEVGRCAIWLGESAMYGYQKALHRLRPHSTSTDVPRFLYYAMRAAASSNAFSDGHVSTIAHLTGDKLQAHRFAFPPLEEQQAIVDYLDASLERIDRLILAAKQEMTFIREYRTRLITDVVTGQLDVREAASKLPDEADEPDETSLADDILEEVDEADLEMDDTVEEVAE
jgi:type I restriction enzyme, S subunit